MEMARQVSVKCTDEAYTKYVSVFHQQLHEAMTDKMFTDIIVMVGQEKFHLHKIILFASSGYFRKQLVTEECFTLPDSISHDTFCQIRDYLYCAEIKVFIKDLPALLRAAQLFQLTHLSDWCMRRVHEELDRDPAMCLEMLVYTQDNYDDCLWLREKCISVACLNFSSICCLDTFYKLSPRTICELLKQDCLKSDCEFNVYVSVINWIKDTRNDRHRLESVSLLENVRFGLIPLVMYSDIIKEELFCDEERRDVFVKGHDYLTARNVQCKLQRAGSLCVPRCEPSLVVVGGDTAHPGISEAVYAMEIETDIPRQDDLQLGDPKHLRSLPHARHSAMLVTYFNFLFVIGGKPPTAAVNGSDEPYFCDTVCFDSLENTWIQLTPMPNRCRSAATFILKNIIYIIGGFNGKEALTHVQRYDIFTNTWEEGKSLTEGLSSLKGCVLGGQAYTSGGIVSGKGISNNVMKYDVEKGEFIFCGEMLQPRHSHGFCAGRDRLYIVGGKGENEDLVSLEEFNPDSQQSVNLRPMSLARCRMPVVYHQQKLVVCGGWEAQKEGDSWVSDAILIYDIQQGKWHKSSQPLSQAIQGGCAAIMNIPQYNPEANQNQTQTDLLYSWQGPSVGSTVYHI